VNVLTKIFILHNTQRYNSRDGYTFLKMKHLSLKSEWISCCRKLYLLSPPCPYSRDRGGIRSRKIESFSTPILYDLHAL